MMNSMTVNRRGFFVPANKGQKFKKYSEGTKREAVRLRVEEQWSYSMIKS